MKLKKKIKLKKNIKLWYLKNLKKSLIILKKRKKDILLFNKIKNTYQIKKKSKIKKSHIFYKYHIFNSILNVYNKIKSINEFNNVVSVFNKKKIDIFIRKSYLEDVVNKSSIKKQHLVFTILNSNISVIGDYKRYGIIKCLNNVFIGKSLYNIIHKFWFMDPTIKKYEFFDREQKWFRSINRKEPFAFNLNNIFIISFELMFFIKLLSVYYFIFYNKLTLLWSSFIKSIKKNFFLVNNKQYLFIKQYKNLFKNIKFYIYNINKFKKLYVFYWLNFKKFNTIYKKFLSISTLSNIKYNEFSFRLPRPKKNINKKKKNLYYVKKKRNMVYIINNIIYKFFYFIFLYWFNIYIIYNLQINKLSLFLNNLYFNNNVIISINFYNYFYQRRYRKRYQYKKIQFLDHFKNNKFLLYYKNTINLNE